MVVGAGGVGKTRLALEIGEEWETGGRTRVLVASGKEAEALEKARGVTAGPVLLVVDYAETRTGLGDLLRAVLDDPGPVRVLLLARSLGEWWDRLAEESSPGEAQLLSAVSPIRLEAQIEDVPDADLAVAALPFFATKLGVTPPGGVVFDLPPGRVPVLVLHAAALVAVLRSMTSPPGPLRVAVTEGVLDELLRHEARYWRRTAMSCGLPKDGRVLRAVVAAAILLGACDLEEAVAVTGRVPDLAGASTGNLRQWARWLYLLYPSGPAGRLGSVQPDLLAEHHVAAQLTSDPGLAKAVLHDLTIDQAERALTVLARAWDLHEGAGQMIEAALRADLAGMALPAATVAVQTRAEVGALLASALSDAPATLGDLIKIEDALPFPSLAVDIANLAATQRIRRELPPGTGKHTIARWSDMTGLLLSQLGRPADALPPTEEAVAIHRELAAANPDIYLPGLARSLSILSFTLSELGRPADALSPTEEAVAIARELAAAKPDIYRSGLAAVLSNLGIRFSRLGRPADALLPIQEAVAIARELAAAKPDIYLPGLAASLSTLSRILSQLGRPADALSPTEEAVAIRRELAAANPDSYRPDPALSLNNLSLRLSELGRPADALGPAQEAVAIYRELAAAIPDRYRADLADSLNHLSDILSI